VMTQPRVAPNASLPPIPPRSGPMPKGAMPPPIPPPRAVGTEAEAEAAAELQRVDRKREVSDAFQAIVVPDQDLAEAGMLDEPAQVYAPALPSAAMPPGAAPERPGSYAQHRKRESQSIQAVDPAIAERRAHRPSEVTSPEAPRPRTPTPSNGPARVPQARTVSPTAPRPSQVPTTQLRSHPQSSPPPATARTTQTVRPIHPTGPPPAGPGGPGRAVPPGARPRPLTGGNVVQSRPAVIIGGPPKVVGGAPAAPPVRGTQTRVRKAREDSESGMFGQDLISEKSLDEVILAYLSEDAGEE
jgi:hypothetical protein